MTNLPLLLSFFSRFFFIIGFLYHQYNTYIPFFTDGSKTTTRVGCGVVIADVPSSFQLNALCSVLTAELTAIFLALERISDLLEHKFCIYSDSKSALEALSHPQNGTHPLALDILCLLQSLKARDFQILFCWLPGHVGIQGMNWLILLQKQQLLLFNNHFPTLT
ncbi:hypothetical protein AVEN_39864-1 [Araneus ventricosus]|uniref:RNase H type-1 domain-containing protein n=1 Tax=Araneus ventricosus TaxID=182803 RepID=A0A4Y2BZK2_ARAVE|nr:hypothetical protein AVEN_39864-1 [Araneus ventricosus]